jgi:hypothetical protein
MITSLDVHPGDSLKVSCPRFWAEPKSATVVWVSEISSTSRRVGIKVQGQEEHN